MNKYINRYDGLTQIQVSKRIKLGQVNCDNLDTTKSYKRIIISNVFTYFNFINIALFSLILLVKSYKNGLFIMVIVINTINSIYREFKAKKILDGLTILSNNNIEVIRNNKLYNIATNELVKDDLFILRIGQQVPTDSIVIEGSLEVNESLLTGESDAIQKNTESTLLSGSFVTSGNALCKVTSVGLNNYSQKIVQEAKKQNTKKSQLQKSLNTILKIVSIFLIPIGFILFSKQYFLLNISLENTITSTVAAVLGMIPEGLVLLTSAALTLGVIRLAKKNVLVQELFCIENLARIDTLCLDKTGTITSGNMIVNDIIPLTDDCFDGLDKLIYNLDNDNATFNALVNFRTCTNKMKADDILPFNSARKYSAVSFKNDKNYYIGALEFLFNDINDNLYDMVSKYTNDGYRVLVIAKSKNADSNYSIQDLEPIGIITLLDEIRPNAKETINYFYKQNVNSIIISGDDPITVSAIAKKVGIKNIVSVNATNLSNKDDLINALKVSNVFGRVTPNQKKEIIQCLQTMGKTVAMTGDGVNDILALKQADCSIAMASGSDACKRSSNIVLLDNDFTTLPDVVNEGRRVINNITSSSVMFLIKTIFSLLLSITTIIFSASYPFEPIQLSIISSFGVGIPTFFLTYERNFEKVKGSFIENVFLKSFPTAFLIASISTLTINVGLYLNYNSMQLNTICFIFTCYNYCYALIRNYPLTTKYRKFIVSTVLIGLCLTIILFKNTLELVILPTSLIIYLVIIIMISPKLLDVIFRQSYKIYKKH